jgi:SAM-dependent methyltransferase
MVESLPPDYYDRIAAIYDDDIGRNAPPGDRDYYLRVCRGRGPILELGCGTGRITLPLVQAGLEVWGIDASGAMLRVLERKAAAELSPAERRRLHCQRVDMRHADFSVRFPTIICPFSTFGYLVEEPDQLRLLDVVRAHLAPDGRFHLDMYVPDPTVMAMPDDHVFHDYRRPRADGTVLERNKAIAKDTARGVSVTTRYYRVFDAGGRQVEAFVTTHRSRFFYPGQLLELLRRGSFEVVERWGDFQGRPFDVQGPFQVLACRPIGGA